MFDRLETLPPDALLGLIRMFNADKRADRIDLGVGVYRTDDGMTPVFRSIKTAEARLLAQQDSKAYLGPEGDSGFVEALIPVIFGSDAPAGGRMAGVQTPGGTGAVRLACDIIKRAGGSRVLLGSPSWPNHAPIIRAAGLEPVSYNHADLATQTLDFASLLAALDAAEPGDAVLLHACCHNPTGIDYDAGQWSEIADRIAGRRLLPLIDLAYQGLGDGFEEDAAGMRNVLAAVPEAFVAYSCDKNFGVYRDRVGALYAVAADAGQRDAVNSNMLALARSNWSMPPDHGAAAVRMVLTDDALRADWLNEVAGMRARLGEMRGALAAAGQVGTLDLTTIGHQKGLFSVLPLSPEVIARLRDDHGIYMAGSGRINIAGFTLANMGAFLGALTAVLEPA